jgi:hypothetical protein
MAETPMFPHIKIMEFRSKLLFAKKKNMTTAFDFL